IRECRVVVAVVAKEPGIVVLFIYIVGDHVVVVVDVVPRNDAVDEVHQGDVGIAHHSPAGRDDPVIPVVAADKVPVVEGIQAGYGKQVPLAGVVIDHERVTVAVPVNLILLVTPGIGIVPGIAGEQHPDATVGIDSENRDIAGA